MPKPRVPTAILELRGSFKTHPERRRGCEPEFTGDARCPQYLDREGRKEWQRIAPELRRLGLLKSADRVALAMYCSAVSLAIAAQREITDKGIILSGGRKHPACNVWRDAAQIIRQFAAEFGMTPSSRSKVAVPPVEDRDNPFAEIAEKNIADRYFGGGK